ncbi:hypothetical protein [Shinella zoogloeoides]|uniref:hypothetical protein n=1 Tax=Shinella zoogloeoides TaxID=352475 RepID=UPI00273FE3A4|nr:hypothetical protein [Shinella zoogloeoides]WLR91012.1 hypothetical protein Q9316_00255 [Shinella zoogloeoides]
MANRILLDQTGLFISAAGVDVLSALEKDLIFSSNYVSTRKFLGGTVFVSANSQATINYGTTLAGVPIGIFYVDDGALALHPIIQATTAVLTDMKEFAAFFNSTSVTFRNYTTSGRTFQYSILEVMT